MCSLVQFHFDRSTPMDLFHQCMNYVKQLLFVWKNESTTTNTYNTSLHFWGKIRLSAVGKVFCVQTFLTLQQGRYHLWHILAYYHPS